MDVSTYIRPNTKNFIEGYDLLRTFLSETKSRFASDSIEDICYDGKNCKLKLCQECDLSCDSLEGMGFSTMFPGGFVELLFENVKRIFPTNKKSIDTFSYHADLLIDTIKDKSGMDCGISLRYIHSWTGDDIFNIEAKFSKLLSFERMSL